MRRQPSRIKMTKQSAVLGFKVLCQVGDMAQQINIITEL